MITIDVNKLFPILAVSMEQFPYLSVIILALL